jgi:hypothetical protein
LAIAIFGSVARREADRRSDLDVLVVHEGVLPDELLDAIPDHVSIASYSPVRLEAMPDRSPLFSVHMAQESAIVSDPTGRLTTVLARVSPLDKETVRRLLTATRRRLHELMDQPRGLYLDPQSSSAELYALAKQAAMLLCAADGHYEFNRRRALRHAYERASIPIADRHRISGLEDLWQAARCSEDDSRIPSDLDSTAAAVRRLVRAFAE